VDRALELEPNLGDAYSARMLIQMNYDFDWKGARESLRKVQAAGLLDANVLFHALELDNIFDQTDYDRHIALVRQAVSLDPMNPRLRALMIEVCAKAHRFTESRAAFEQWHVLLPGITGIGMLAMADVIEGNFTRALTEAQQVPVEWFKLSALALAHAGMKNTEASDAALQQLIAGYPEQCALQIAQVYAYRHDPDNAFAWLDRAYQQRDSGLHRLKSDEFLMSLHRDPRWPVLLRKMGMADDQLK
jgi:tetratricopeptide (TPR) repeat protein